METHKSLLNTLCRICGRTKSRSDRPFVPAKNHQEALHFSFLVEVGRDVPEIHPTLLCHKCRCRATREFAISKEKNDKGKFKDDVIVFQQHDDISCFVCGTSKAAPSRGTPNRVTSSVMSVDTCSLEHYIESADDLTSVVKSLPMELQVRLANALGQSVSSEVYKDAVAISGDYNSPSNMMFESTHTWVSQRHPVINSFIDGATQSSTGQKSKKALYAQAKAVDSVYKARFSKFISTLSFAENLTLYPITGSKAAVNMSSASSSGGGISSILTWLKSQAKTGPAVFPEDGDLFVAIDNEQVVGKTWRVYANRKVPTSIVTSVIAMRLPDSRQQENWLIPSSFSNKFREDGLDAVHSEVLDDECSRTASLELNKYIKQRLHCLEQEQQGTLNGWTDAIDEEIGKPVVTTKVCSKCGKEQQVVEQQSAENNAKVKPTCESCGEKHLKNVQSHGELFTKKRDNSKRQHCFRVDPEEFVPAYKQPKRKDEPCPAEVTPSTENQTATQPCQLHVADPVFVNPNSYDTITEVLRHVGRCAGISKYGSGKRKWTFVIMDGLPFTMAYNIVQGTYTCKLCQISVFGADKKMNHCTEVHEGEDSFMDREFDWVVLRIGHGHFEMNMKKAFMEVNFAPFMADITNELGFKSANAQKYVKQCSDNHKAWDLMCIARGALADELLRPYVLKCLNTHTPCTVKGYFAYAMDNIQNPNYKYIYEQIFVYCQAITNFRNGLRGNEHTLLISGKEKFSPIWFCRNHPKYQSIHVCDSHDRFCYSDDVRRMVASYESFSFTGNPRSGEGLDFVLENVNKKVKAILANGVPNADDWMLAFRNYHELENIRKATHLRMGITDPSSGSPKLRNYDDEIKKCRCLIRKSGILTDPHADMPFQSLNGKKLKDNLLEITAIGQRNKQMYTNCLKTSRNPPKDITYVIATDEEITVKSRTITKASLAGSITGILNHLPHSATTEYLHEQWKEVKKGNKQDYIDFFKSIELIEISPNDDDELGNELE